MENQIRFYGRGGEFFGIWIVNILLSVVTLGIYSAWAKVRTKKYFYGNTELGADRFDYHGQPLQILKGRIVAIICVWVWVLSSNTLPLLSGVLLLLFIALMPWLIVSNTRFDARMTSYRNVRFNFVGTLGGAYMVFLGWPAALFVLFGGSMALAANLPTALAGVLGLVIAVAAFIGYAWIAMRSSAYFVNGYRYGNRPFTATLTTRAYVKTYLLAGALGAALSLVMVLIMGFSVGLSALTQLAHGPEAINPGALIFMGVFFYISMFVVMLVVSGFVHARIRNYVFSQVSVEGEPAYGLGSRMTAGGLVMLHLTNFLLALVTLGFGRPWIMVRSARYVADCTVVYGDLSQLTAQGEPFGDDSAIGDEMANAFDLDVGIG